MTMRLAFSHALGGAILFGIASFATASAAAGCEPGAAKYAGHYYLNGVMEVGSELLLKPDGSFEFMLAYGANDQYGKGCWVAKGSRLEVIPAGRKKASTSHTPDNRGFGGLVLTISGRALIWDIGESGYKGRYEKG